jgi:mRNA interferase RelE/StbE
VSGGAIPEAPEESWSVSFAKRADKDMERLDPPVRQRVSDGIERLADDEHSSSDVRKLKGSDELRLRVGDWRVRFKRDTEKREIVVLRVLHRGRAYKR